MPTKKGEEGGSQSTGRLASDDIQDLADQYRQKMREVTKSCHSCAMTNWALSRPGITVRLRLKGEGPYQRDRHQTVWCCGEDCAWQALAIAARGLPTHRWPIRLRDFVSLNPELLEQSQIRSEGDKTPISNPHKQRGCEGAKPESDPTPLPRGFVPRKGGRPRIHKDVAARKRAYRARRRQRAGTREKVESQLASPEPTNDLGQREPQSTKQPDSHSGIASPDRTVKEERFDGIK